MTAKSSSEPNPSKPRQRRPEERKSAPGPRESALSHEPNRFVRFLKVLGPGLVTGASDDDPSGIGTYAITGASLGFGMLWTALITIPMMAAIQFTCAKIAIVTGRGLAGVIKTNYSRKLLYPAVAGLIIANTINVGADLGAIAAAINLLVPIPITAMIIPITLTIIAALFWGSYRIISSVFKWLTLALFAYVGAAIVAHPDGGEVLKGTLLPEFSLNPTFLSTLVAILGTTISPYLWFWQSSQEVEEEMSMGRRWIYQRKGTSSAELKYAAWDVNTGMVFSNVVMYFIILATGATLFKAGQNNIQSAADAASALRPLAGDAATILFALGLIGAGFLAIPILAGSSAYAVCETFSWGFGLSKDLVRASQFYGIIAASMLIGMEINFLGINPIMALFWTAVINGLLAPPLLVIIMLIANNGSIMKERTNGLGLNVLGWATTAAMFMAAIGLIYTWINPPQ